MEVEDSVEAYQKVLATLGQSCSQIKHLCLTGNTVVDNLLATESGNEAYLQLTLKIFVGLLSLDLRKIQ